MKASLLEKLVILKKRYEEVSFSLGDPVVLKDQNKYKSLSKEFAQLSPIVKCFEKYQQVIGAIEAAESLVKDESLGELALEELKEAKPLQEELERELQILLLPKDPDDAKNIFLEIRAGTGGDEAAIFAGDLSRMYIYYGESKGWQVEVINSSTGEHGGYKEIILRIVGQDVYSRLKFESGGHRVQRVPETESQGRIHTSACTIAVLPEAEAIDDIDINPADLRIDTYRAGGAGGQHVNVTDSAVRVTHIPSGLVVECQDERSQHKNKARALSLLQARLLAKKRREQHEKRALQRRVLIGSGDRSERIRTYNFPQSRVTDHRIGLTLYQLQDILEGHMDALIDPIIQEAQAELLTSISE